MINIIEKIRSLFIRGADNDAIPIKDYESLESEKQKMIKSVIEFGETTVKEIMVPRTDTVFLNALSPIDETLDTITASGHSRFPVYKETLDNVIGIVYVKDVLDYLVKAQRGAQNEAGADDFSLEKIVHKAYFVPETKHIDVLFHEFQSRHVHIAVVADEYGGVSGIVSMEDILEEIVGDIQDEFDNEKEEITRINDSTYLADARCNLGDFAEYLRIDDLPVDEFDSLGGFVFDLFGKIPAKNESVRYNNITFTVQDIEGRKIDTIRVCIGAGAGE